MTTGPVMPRAAVRVSEVVDPLGERARRCCGRSEQPMPSWSTATTRQPGLGAGEESAPQIGPGGIAVYAEQRPLAGRRRRCPADARCAARRRVADPDRTRPGRIESRHRAEQRRRCGGDVQRLDHQTSSAYEVFRPEPMPRAGSHAGVQLVQMLGQGERHRGRADVAVGRQGERELRLVDTQRVGHGPDVHHRGLVGDEAVDAGPVEVGLGVIARSPWPARDRPRRAAWCRSA